MLAVVLPTTPNPTSPTPPTTTTSASGSGLSSSSSTVTMQRKASTTSSVNFRPVVSSRGGGSSGSIHFQHQVPPSRASSYHVNGHASSSSTTIPSITTTVLPVSVTPKRPATPPPPPPPDSPSKQPTPPSPQPPFDIASYSSTDLLKLLASLLTQIAATNDSLPSAHSSSHPSSPTSPQHTGHAPQIHSPIWNTLTTASRTALSTPASTLTFHARNVPTISLESYFLRILKYCPTTNHVFLSLLVYFDRMAKLSLESTGRAFVIDSYNVHRLVIAGVTVSSKFFSDVFYTNSRYAKVGGLPLHELNQLELQFLLLNDFRLVIKGDEMQRYAEQLILFSKSTSGKEKALEIQIPQQVQLMDIVESPGAVNSHTKPILQVPGMQRRDSQNAYSSFPSAVAPAPGPSPTTPSSSSSGHTRSGSGGYPAHHPQHHFPQHQHNPPSALLPSSSQHTLSAPFQQPYTAGHASAIARKRSTTPPGPTFHPPHSTFSRSSAAPSAPPSSLAEAKRRVPEPASRRTPPIHIATATRNSLNGRTHGQHAAYSDDDDEEDEESDDYDDSDDEDDLHRNLSHARRRRRHTIPISNDAETEEETETETDAGETTDGGSGSTTSDEPTVRPVGVGRRRSMSTSTSSFGDDVGEDGADEGSRLSGGRGMEMEGEGTPEVMRQNTPRGEGPEGDVSMGSPPCP